MGMDSCIYKSSKENFEKYNKQKLKIKELYAKGVSFVDSLIKKYDIKNGWTDGLRESLEANCTEEEINFVDSYIAEWRNEKDALKEDIFTEEFYWSKAYGLHQFITQKFLNNGEKDNCVHIPLSRENIEIIITELKTNPRLFENDRWNSYDTEYAIGCFTQLLDEYSNDVVITYWSWY